MTMSSCSEKAKAKIAHKKPAGKTVVAKKVDDKVPNKTVGKTPSTTDVDVDDLAKFPGVSNKKKRC